MAVLVYNTKIIDNGDLSQPSIVSATANTSEVVMYAINTVWTDGEDLSGTISIQASNTDDPSSFKQITPIYINSNSGTDLFNVERAGYAFVRVVYTRISGSGTLNVKISAKGF